MPTWYMCNQRKRSRERKTQIHLFLLSFTWLFTGFLKSFSRCFFFELTETEGEKQKKSIMALDSLQKMPFNLFLCELSIINASKVDNCNQINENEIKMVQNTNEYRRIRRQMDVEDSEEFSLMSSQLHIYDVKWICLFANTNIFASYQCTPLSTCAKE